MNHSARLTVTLSLAALALAVARPLYAGTYDAEEQMAHKYEIVKRTLEAVNNQVTHESVLEKYGLQPPILPPRYGKGQVMALIAKQVEEELEKRFPRSRFQEIEKEVQERYRLYKVGDVVKLRVRDSRRGDHWLTVEGPIRGISKRGVTVQDRFYPQKDVSPDEAPHFSRAAHEKKVEKMIELRVQRYLDERKQAESELKRTIAPEVWRREGYMYIRPLRQWKARSEVFNRKYEEAWEAAYNLIWPEMEASVKRELGYVWNDVKKRWEKPTAETGDTAEQTATAEDDEKDETDEDGGTSWLDEIETRFRRDTDEKKDDDGEDLWKEEDGKKDGKKDDGEDKDDGGWGDDEEDEDNDGWGEDDDAGEDAATQRQQEKLYGDD